MKDSFDALVVGPVIVAPRTCKVLVDDPASVGAKVLQLAPTQYKILYGLALRAPGRVSISELEKEVWGRHTPTPNALNTHMCRIRQEMERKRPGSSVHLQGTPTMGYSLSV